MARKLILMSSSNHFVVMVGTDSALGDTAPSNAGEDWKKCLKHFLSHYNLLSLPRLMDFHHSSRKLQRNIAAENKTCNFKRYSAQRLRTNISCWNIRTVQDTVDSIHSARRFAILAHEFGSRSLNIIALPEIRLPKECYRKEVGYTFYSRGKSGEAKRESWVGFAS